VQRTRQQKQQSRMVVSWLTLPPVVITRIATGVNKEKKRCFFADVLACAVCKTGTRLSLPPESYVTTGTIGCLATFAPSASSAKRLKVACKKLFNHHRGNRRGNFGKRW